MQEHEGNSFLVHALWAGGEPRQVVPRYPRGMGLRFCGGLQIFNLNHAASDLLVEQAFMPAVMLLQSGGFSR
jgi:hypothetical protein